MLQISRYVLLEKEKQQSMPYVKTVCQDSSVTSTFRDLKQSLSAKEKARWFCSVQHTEDESEVVSKETKIVAIEVLATWKENQGLQHTVGEMVSAGIPSQNADS